MGLEKKIFKCPKCGKLSFYEGSYCTNCYEDYNNMNLTDKNFFHPIYEKIFYDLRDSKQYKKMLLFTSDYGVMIYPNRGGTYEEDAFLVEFRKKGNILYLAGDYDNVYIFGNWYLQSKEYNFMYYEFKKIDEAPSKFKKKYVRVNDKEDYVKVIMPTDDEGILYRHIKGYDGEISEFYTHFIKRGNTLTVPNSDMDEKFELGDWYLNVCMQGFNYKGRIPEGNYFDVYCETGTLAAMEYWYTVDGDLYVFDPSIKAIDKALKPVNKGKYVREGNIIRQELYSTRTGKVERSIDFVIDGKYCINVYVVEDQYEYYNKEASKPLEVLNPMVALPIISEKEFFDNYPCPYCNARQIWTKKSWNYYASGNISVYAECKICGGIAQEIETEYDLKKIAYHGSKPNPYYRAPAGSVHYLDNPCPYCKAYQVRYIKWKDKVLSVSFWGRASSKLGAHYICDNCKKTWE